MSAQIIPFDFEKHPVRVAVIDDVPWFVASDVCKALGLTNSRKALTALDPDEKGVTSSDTPGGQQELATINESGLYTLILRGRNATKPGTPQHRFRKWVTAEVLPAIRKHGHYHDDDSQLGTLIGQTIGTDGFHMLGALIKGKVACLPTAQRRAAIAKLWSQTHTAFGVRCAADIPAEQLDAARNFVASYAIEGEYLGRAEAEVPSMASLEAVVRHCRAVERDWVSTVGPAVRQLNPGLAGAMREHIGAARRLAEGLARH